MQYLLRRTWYNPINYERYQAYLTEAGCGSSNCGINLSQVVKRTCYTTYYYRHIDTHCPDSNKILDNPKKVTDGVKNKVFTEIIVGEQQQVSKPCPNQLVFFPGECPLGEIGLCLQNPRSWGLGISSRILLIVLYNILLCGQVSFFFILHRSEGHSKRKHYNTVCQVLNISRHLAILYHSINTLPNRRYLITSSTMKFLGWRRGWDSNPR